MTGRASIITFSRRTDPAFHMDRLMEWLDRGECAVPNPFSGKPYRVGLRPEEVALLTFWTRNPGAVAAHLEDILARGFRTAFFITLTGYPAWLEPAVPGRSDVATGTAKIREMLGKDAVWWRYDPIILTDSITAQWHIENFTGLCEEIWQGATGRVIVSLAHIDGPYARIRKRLSGECARRGGRLLMPSYEEFADLTYRLAGIAAGFGVELEVCCSPAVRDEHRDILRQEGCLSERYVRRIVPDLPPMKVKGTRRGNADLGYAPCTCLESRDIGERGTCRHGCVYCYANR